MSISNLPAIGDLFSDSIEIAKHQDELNVLLSQQPKKEWVKVHPFIKDYRYLPIDKIEFLLKKIFKKYSIEITNQGTAFNGVWVTVRVHYFNPIFNEMMSHDGIGACQLQTKGGTSPADLININNGALSMAYPIAKTIAIKDACDHFGDLFGANLNRKDVIPFTADQSLINATLKDIKELFDIKREELKSEDVIFIERIIATNETKSFRKVYQKLQKI